MAKTIQKKSEYSPIKQVRVGVYIINWDYKELEDQPEYASWACEKIYHKPVAGEIKKMIVGYYNNIIDNKILKEFVWNNMPIWLSSENQFNYKAAYDLAVQTNGSSLPVTFKFGTDAKPIYYTFTTVEELGLFYTAMVQYINDVLTAGWQKKDSIDWNQYVIE